VLSLLYDGEIKMCRY